LAPIEPATIQFATRTSWRRTAPTHGPWFGRRAEGRAGHAPPVGGHRRGVRPLAGSSRRGAAGDPRGTGRHRAAPGSVRTADRLVPSKGLGDTKLVVENGQVPNDSILRLPSTR